MREKNSRLSRGEAIADLLWLPMHVVLLPLLAGFALSRALCSDMTANLMVDLIGTVFLAFALRSFLGRDFPTLFRRPLQLLIIPAVFLGQRFFEALLAVVFYLFDFGSNINNDTVYEMLGNHPYAMTVMAVLLAPFVEECLFRAGIFGLIRRKSPFLAYAVSILAFGLYHVWQGALYDPRQLLFALQYLPAGFALAWVYDRCDSIWASILLHMLANGTAILVSL